MPRHIKIGLIVLAVGFAVSLGFFVDIVGRIRSMVNDTETAENPFTPPVAPLYAPTDPPMQVKIFFPTVESTPLLSAEDSTIFKSKEVVNRAKQILQKLQEGPTSSKMVAALPKDAKPEEIFISEKGTAFIDFANTITTNHSGGILNEQATIYSIVNTLVYNLPEIREVKILIGGTEKETLAGHVLLLLPLVMDLSISDVAPPETHSVAQQ
jgi:sporulation and spore germination protein